MVAINETDEQFYYYFDIDSIIDYISKPKEQSDDYEKIENIYNEKNELESTIVTTQAVDPKIIDIKYDLIKKLIESVLEPNAEGNNNNGFEYIKDIENASIGFKIALNTMLNSGFIKNKN